MTQTDLRHLIDYEARRYCTSMDSQARTGHLPRAVVCHIGLLIASDVRRLQARLDDPDALAIEAEALRVRGAAHKLNRYALWTTRVCALVTTEVTDVAV